MKNIHVTLSGDATHSHTTDVTGVYHFTGLKTGNYVITAEATGFVKQIKNIEAAQTGTIKTDFVMAVG